MDASTAQKLDLRQAIKATNGYMIQIKTTRKGDYIMIIFIFKLIYQQNE